MMDWKTIKRILQYLKGTVDYSFCYQGKELCLVGYSHVIWAGDLNECKLTSKYSFLLNNSVNLWKSNKQTCIALSTMEVEFTIFFNCNIRSCMVEKIFAKLGNNQGFFLANDNLKWQSICNHLCKRSEITWKN